MIINKFRMLFKTKIPILIFILSVTLAPNAKAVMPEGTQYVDAYNAILKGIRDRLNDPDWGTEKKEGDEVTQYDLKKLRSGVFDLAGSYYIIPENIDMTAENPFSEAACLSSVLNGGKGLTLVPGEYTSNGKTYYCDTTIPWYGIPVLWIHFYEMAYWLNQMKTSFGSNAAAYGFGSNVEFYMYIEKYESFQYYCNTESETYPYSPPEEIGYKAIRVSPYISGIWKRLKGGEIETEREYSLKRYLYLDFTKYEKFPYCTSSKLYLRRSDYTYASSPPNSSYSQTEYKWNSYSITEGTRINYPRDSLSHPPCPTPTSIWYSTSAGSRRSIDAVATVLTFNYPTVTIKKPGEISDSNADGLVATGCTCTSCGLTIEEEYDQLEDCSEVKYKLGMSNGNETGIKIKAYISELDFEGHKYQNYSLYTNILSTTEQTFTTSDSEEAKYKITRLRRPMGNIVSFAWKYKNGEPVYGVPINNDKATYKIFPEGDGYRVDFENGVSHIFNNFALIECRMEVDDEVLSTTLPGNDLLTVYTDDTRTKVISVTSPFGKATPQYQGDLVAGVEYEDSNGNALGSIAKTSGTTTMNGVSANFNTYSKKSPSGTLEEQKTVTQAEDGTTVIEEFNIDNGAATTVAKTTTYTNVEYDEAGVFGKREEVQAGSYNIVRETVYKNFSWGSEVIEEIESPDTNDEKTTTYEYYETGNGKGKLKSVVNYDGSWTRYEYDEAGRVIKEVSPFVNTTIDSEDSLCKVTEYSYEPVTTADTAKTEDSRARTIIQKVMGYEVGRSYNVYLPNEYRSITCETAGAAWDAADNLVSITYSYTSGDFEGRTMKSVNPDGSMTVYSYAMNGANLETTIDSGFGTGMTVSDGTRSFSITDGMGNTVSSATTDIASGLTLSSVSYTRDGFGRATRIDYSNGTYTTTVYGCCGPESQTDKAGSVTTYAYNALKQLDYTTRAGITTFYTYDALGNTVSTTVKGSAGSEITTTNEYNSAGTLVATTDALGHVTTNNEDFVYGKLIQTSRNPDNTTNITVYNLDGSVAEQKGSASRHVKYEYGVENGEQYTKTIMVGDGGSETNWVKTYTNFKGQPYKTVYPDGATEMTYYDSLGRPIRQVGPTGITTLTAYNSKGEVEAQAVDMDRDGVIDYDGTDRITKYANQYTTYNSSVVRENTVSSYLQENNSTPTVVSVSRSSVDGLKSWQESFSRSSNSVTTYNGGGQTTTVSTNPDGTTVTSVYLNGRLMSSTHSVLGATSYTYDEFGRMKTVSQTIGGVSQTITYQYNNNGQVTSIVDSAGRPSTFFYDSMGRRIKTLSPGNSVVNYEYSDTGELTKTYGTNAYPQTYSYDALGRMKTLNTFKSYPSETETTTWNYDAQRGFMTSKVYADGKQASYSYNLDGSLNVRTWARGITTTYTYDNAGALAGVDYSDTTPDIAYVYNRMGQPSSVTDGAGAWTMTYNSDSSIASCACPHIVDKSVAYGYDTLGRRTSMSLMNDTTAVRSTGYGYDSASRISTVSDGTRSATYSRVSGSNMLSTTTVNNGSSDILTTTRNYDNLNRLTAISSSTAGKTYSYAYALNDRDQRSKCTLADGSYWIYEYDDLGQVTKGKKYSSSGSEIPGQSFGYDYDTIGNLKTEDRNGNILNYTSNNVNQYTERTVPGRINISGLADEDAAVSVNRVSLGQSSVETPSRTGKYFNLLYQFDNSTSSFSDTFDVYAVKFDTANNRDVIKKQSIDIYVAKTPEAFTYDDDGNMLTDGRWTYTWNGENRLISVVETDVKKLEFAYDFNGRRINKKAYTWNSGTSSWDLSYEHKFVYDGWNLTAVYDGSNNLLTSYCWGEDISGSLQGAGGVGGLLSVLKSGNVYYPVYDANGNIREYLDGSGNAVASYKYDPFGKLICKSGSMADDFVFRFSSKYFDKETGLYYYGYRFYNPDLRRWLNQDPMGEIKRNGKFNLLYTFVDNNAVNSIDLLGLNAYIVYRKLAINYLNRKFPFVGHVYIAFDNKNMGEHWKELLKRYEHLGIDPKEEYQTFSFHPWSVKEKAGEKYNRASVILTESSYVDRNNKDADIRPIKRKKVIMPTVTKKEGEQCKLFNRVVTSWLVNSASPEMNDGGYYAFSYNNCGSWATRMVRESGIPLPYVKGFNMGTGIDNSLGSFSGAGLYYLTSAGFATYDAVSTTAVNVKDGTVSAAKYIKNETKDSAKQAKSGFWKTLQILSTPKGWAAVLNFDL